MSRRSGGNWRGDGFLINAAYWSGVIPLALLVVIPAVFWPVIEHFVSGVPATIGEALFKQVAWLVLAVFGVGFVFVAFAVVWLLWKLFSWLLGLMPK
jgi:hypothetical protein